MNKTKDEKKSALKLINKYAESYSILEEENKQLKNEINDLKLNLKINKEIIESFFSGKKGTNITSILQKKMKQEYQTNLEYIETLKKEKDELRYKLQMAEQNYAGSVNLLKQENEKLQSKLFIMDNCIVKKDNIINVLRQKLSVTPNGIREREVLLAEPSHVSLALQSDLTSYKEDYHRLVNIIKELKIKLLSSDRFVQELKQEIFKLTYELQFHINTNYEKKKKSSSYYSTTGSDVNNEEYNICRLSNVPGYERKYYEFEEWWNDALKAGDLCMEEFNHYKLFKTNTKLMNLIEFLNSVILDKNFHLRIIENEFISLNEKYEALSKENVDLYEQIKDVIVIKDSGRFDSPATINQTSNNNANENNNNNKNNNTNNIRIRNYEPSVGSVTSSEFVNGIDGNFLNDSAMLDNIDISISLR
jgi:hypothetical protein